MDIEEWKSKFDDAYAIWDIKEMQSLFSLHPEMKSDPDFAGSYFSDIVRCFDFMKMKEFLDLGVDVNIHQNRTMKFNVLECVFVRDEQVEEALTLLLNRGISINTLENPDGTLYPLAISVAIRRGYLSAVKKLVEHGAILNTRDRTNRTPLKWAIDYGQTEIAEYLRSKGAVEEPALLNATIPAMKDQT